EGAKVSLEALFERFVRHRRAPFEGVRGGVPAESAPPTPTVRVPARSPPNRDLPHIAVPGASGRRRRGAEWRRPRRVARVAERDRPGQMPSTAYRSRRLAPPPN